MDLERFRCWLLHREERRILIPGILPWQIDAVVFCSRCDRYRGRGERTAPIVFHPLAS